MSADVWRTSGGSQQPCLARSRSRAGRAAHRPSPGVPRPPGLPDRPASPPLAPSWCGQGYLVLGHARPGCSGPETATMQSSGACRPCRLPQPTRSSVVRAQPLLSARLPPPRPGHGCGSSSGDDAARKLLRPTSPIDMPAQRARGPGRRSRAGPDGDSYGTSGHQPSPLLQRRSRAARQERQFQVCSVYY